MQSTCSKYGRERARDLTAHSPFTNLAVASNWPNPTRSQRSREPVEGSYMGSLLRAEKGDDGPEGS